jgi:hypothetical protein
VSEETSTLVELLLSADQFFLEVERRLEDSSSIPEQEVLLLKMTQCRSLLNHLQSEYEMDRLTMENACVRADLRHAIMLLLWAAYYARTLLDFRLFRRLVVIESTFTFLLGSYRVSGGGRKSCAPDSAGE